MADPTLHGQDVKTVLATSLENIKHTMVDNLSSDDAFFFYINQNERVEYEDGGYQIREPVLYGANSTIESYFPGAYINIERPSGFTSLIYTWGFVGGSVVIDGPTKFMNQGKNKIINLVAGYIEQLKISFSQTMTTMLLGDGTGNNGADLLGLDLLVENGSSSYSTVGNINSNTETWWRNYWLDASGTVWGDGPNCFGIQTLKHAARLCTKPGYGQPDVWLTGLDQYELYENAIAKNVHYNQPAIGKEAYVDAGFGSLRLNGIPVLYDINIDAKASMADHWFCLNSKSLRLVIGKNKAFDLSDPVEHPYMDADLMKARMYAQLTLRGRRDACGRIKMNASAS